MITPLSPMPKGWDHMLLDSVADRGSGHTPDREKPEYWDGGIKWVSLTDSDKLDRRWIYQTNSEISALGIRYSSAVLHPPNTVILSRDAGVGKSAVLADEMAVSQHFIAWRCGPNLVPFYLYYWLQSHKPFFERMAVGSTIQTIGLGVFKKLAGSFPPLPEQRKIADILSTWDEALETLDALIAAKDRQKQALMQQLLTGKTRVKGAKGKRIKAKLGELFDERVERNRIDLPLLSITADRGVVSRDELSKRDTSSEDKSKYLRIAPGDIGYNTMRMWQGVSALSALEGIVSPAYTICCPTNRIDGEFAAHFFKYTHTIHLFHRYSQGLVDDTLNLKFHHFSIIEVEIPESLAEQQQIADILDAADQELNLLRTQRQTLDQQKRGLMQRLLTGKIRVKTN
jgi:type I restriction enzyme S subunit